MIGILILLYAIDAVSGGLVPQGCFVAAWVYIGLSFIIGAAGKSSSKKLERTIRSSGKDAE